MPNIKDKIVSIVGERDARQYDRQITQVADALQAELDDAVSDLVVQAVDQGIDRSVAERAFRDAGLLSAPVQDSSSSSSSDTDVARLGRVVGRLADLAERRLGVRVDRS